jgi:hypothetical protein
MQKVLAKSVTKQSQAAIITEDIAFPARIIHAEKGRGEMLAKCTHVNEFRDLWIL